MPAIITSKKFFATVFLCPKKIFRHSHLCPTKTFCHNSHAPKNSSRVTLLGGLSEIKIVSKPLPHQPSVANEFSLKTYSAISNRIEKILQAEKYFVKNFSSVQEKIAQSYVLHAAKSFDRFQAD